MVSDGQTNANVMAEQGPRQVAKQTRALLPGVLGDVFDLDSRKYLFEVTEAAFTAKSRELHVTLALRFLPGHLFCCPEPGCHAPYYDEKRVAEIARLLVKRAGFPKPIILIIDDVQPLTSLATFKPL